MKKIKDLNQAKPTISHYLEKMATNGRHKQKEKNIKPWENFDGSLKTTEKLKVDSQSWSPSIWEEYLKTLETQKSSYELHFGSLIGHFNDEETLAKLIPSSILDELPRLKQIFETGISVKQREVLEKYYLEGLAEEKIAADLGISRRTVRTHRDRALKKIEQALSGKIDNVSVIYTNENSSTRGKLNVS